MSCRVRCAHASELGMVFALLPDMLGQGVPAESTFVAEHRDTASIVGAGAFSIIPKDTRRSGLRGDVFVLPSRRRAGIGTAILEEMRQELRRWNIEYLHSWSAFELGEEPPFLSHAGFKPLRKVFTFEAKTDKANAVCGNLLSRLRAAGRIPAGIALSSLLSADRSDAIRLYAQHFGISEEYAARHFDRVLADASVRELSFALMLDGEMVGFILWKFDTDALPAVDLWISAPGFRSGWPAIVLAQASIEKMSQLGLVSGRFECNDEARATLHIARATESRLIMTASTYALRV